MILQEVEPLRLLLLRTAVGLFGLLLGVFMNACLTLMFSFVQPGRTVFLLGVWGAGYAYSCGLATISGGGLLTLLKPGTVVICLLPMAVCSACRWFVSWVPR